MARRRGRKRGANATTNNAPTHNVNPANPPPPPKRACPQCNKSWIKLQSPQGTLCRPCRDKNYSDEENRHELIRQEKIQAKVASVGIKHEPAAEVKLEAGTMAPCQNCHNPTEKVEVDENGQALCALCLKPFRFRDLPPELQDMVYEVYLDDYVRTKIFVTEPSQRPGANANDVDGVKKHFKRVYAKHVEEGHYFKDRRFTLGSPFEKVDHAANQAIWELLQRDTLKGTERTPIMVQVIDWDFSSAANLIAGFSLSEKTDLEKGITKLCLSLVCIDPSATINMPSLDRFLSELMRDTEITIPFDVVVECLPDKGMYLPSPLREWGGHQYDLPFHPLMANKVKQLYTAWDKHCKQLARHGWLQPNCRAPMKEPGHVWCVCRGMKKAPGGFVVCVYPNGDFTMRHICHTLPVDPHDHLPDCEHVGDIESDEDEDYKPSGKGWQKEFGAPNRRSLKDTKKANKLKQGMELKQETEVKEEADEALLTSRHRRSQIC